MGRFDWKDKPVVERLWYEKKRERVCECP